MAKGIRSIAEITESVCPLNRQMSRFLYKDEVNNELFTEIFRTVGSKLSRSEYVINEKNCQVINYLIKWLCPTEESEVPFNGLLLLGPTGTGKTLMFAIMNEFARVMGLKMTDNYETTKWLQHCQIRSLKIYQDFCNDGFDGLESYEYKPILYIDDFGAEPKSAKHYGNDINVLEYLIEQRYESNLITHFSTNYTMDMVKQKYGDRVYSRIMHSTTILKLIDCDYRIK